MAHQAERAGNIGCKTGSRRIRTSGVETRGLLEGLESRILLSFTPFVDVRSHARHRAVKAAPGFIIGKAASSGPTGLSPAQVRKAYGIDQASFGTVAGDGTGSTIAIVDAYNDPNIQSDLQTFDAQYGLSDPQLTVINQNGGSTLPSEDPNGRGNSWAGEISLDVEWSHAVAPGAKIVLVEANSPVGLDLNAAVAEAKSYPGVSVVSMSFGLSEDSTNLGDNSIYTTPAGHIGVTFVASTGDFGAYGNGGTVKAIQYPAASPNVLAVGGTTLTSTQDGTYISESAWGFGTSSGLIQGGGGGISRFEPQPTYQKGVVTQSATHRTTPDVSFLADPASGVSIYDSYDSPATPWFTFGGTSLAAPMWAGVLAIVNQGRTLAGRPTMDGGTQLLPAIYGLPSSDFNDITTGSNGYSATPGYDLATGRGTPIVNLVVRDLVGVTTVTPPSTPSIGAFTASPTSVTSGGLLTLTASNVAEVGGTIGSVTFYRESNGAAGLQLGSDTVVGVGTNEGGSWVLTTQTLGLAGGNYTYYAVATDTSGVSVTATTVVNVAQAAAVNDFFSNATPIAGTSISVTATNVEATREFKEPVIAKTPGGASVWFVWTAPASGRVSVDTTGSSFDTLLGIYKGTAVSKLGLVASNDDASYAILTSATSFVAKAGVTYHIAVDGYNGAQGSINLHLTQIVPAAKRKK